MSTKNIKLIITKAYDEEKLLTEYRTEIIEKQKKDEEETKKLDR